MRSNHFRISNRGQVFGLAHDSYGPTFYSTSAEPQSRGGCPGGDANDRGDVTSQECHFGPSSAKFDDGSFAFIPEIGIRGTSAATAINNHGTVAGTYAYSSPQPRHAFLWDGTETLDVEYDSGEWRINSVSASMMLA
jgi:probable HAF family extracellular repeat protein